MTDTPVVRVVVVNYNGGATTIEALRSVLATDWPSDALDVVLVDNASTDDVAAIVARDFPMITVVRSDTNVGFAGGVNLGLRDLPDRVAYVALLNSDVTVGRGWLRPLVATLVSRPELGAACPKILLAGRYEVVEIIGTAAPLGGLDRRRVTARVSGGRIGDLDVSRRLRFADGFYGPEFGTGDEAVFEWAGATARLLLPVVPGSNARQLRLAAPRPTSIVLRTDGAETTVMVVPTPRWYELPPSATAFDVVNNVGSELLANGYVRDRGYLERDTGQYDEPTSVFAWCGGAVALPATYLASVGPLDERLFMYYEDVELAWRGRKQGWDYVTVPESVVRHIHMSSSSSNLPRALYFNERNRLVLLARAGSRRAVAAELARFVAVTLSYMRRDIVARLLRGNRPSFTIVGLRLRALVAFRRVSRGPVAQISPSGQ